MVLIISHFKDPWQRDEMAQSKIWKTPIDGVKILHVFGRDSKIQRNNTILVNCEDKYENILQKTIRALKFVEENFEYRFLLRLNVSTYLDIDKFAKFLQRHLSSRNVAFGYFEQHKKKFTLQIPKQLYMSGAAIALDSDAAKVLMELDWEKYRGIPDDVSITHFLWSSGIQLLHLPRCNYHITHLVYNTPYIRVKSSEEVSLTSVRMASIDLILSQNLIWNKIIHYKKLIALEIRTSRRNGSFFRDFVFRIALHMWSRKKCTRAMKREKIERIV